mmetsp:Transcript_42018/g.78052  ORF Transcript_42018/g.78052 Transcript_42018/m.78052 type:complete len:270 (+) Transcript_42018:604-1413(+)
MLQSSDLEWVSLPASTAGVSAAKRLAAFFLGAADNLLLRGRHGEAGGAIKGSAGLAAALLIAHAGEVQFFRVHRQALRLITSVRGAGGFAAEVLRLVFLENLLNICFVLGIARSASDAPASGGAALLLSHSSAGRVLDRDLEVHRAFKTSAGLVAALLVGAAHVLGVSCVFNIAAAARPERTSLLAALSVSGALQLVVVILGYPAVAANVSVAFSGSFSLLFDKPLSFCQEGWVQEFLFKSTGSKGGRLQCLRGTQRDNNDGCLDSVLH